MAEAFFTAARRSYHEKLRDSVLRVDKGVLSIADKDSKASKLLSLEMFKMLQLEPVEGPKLPGQQAGAQFERVTEWFLKETFPKLAHLRPGEWGVRKIGSPGDEESPEKRLEIAQFEQYRHLVAIDKAAKENIELAASLGTDYIIKPDIVVFRKPELDDAINRHEFLIDDSFAQMASVRNGHNSPPILHASISCKLTIRSDRSQNSRSEALNLIRNRRGRLPHVVVVTAEPLPSRLASVALGTGDIDCVYHFALPELRVAVEAHGKSEQRKDLEIMVAGRRLKDISDLPLDLAV